MSIVKTWSNIKPKPKLILTEFQGLTLSTPSLVFTFQVSDQEYRDQEYTIYEQLPVRRQGPSVSKNAEHGHLKWIACPHDLTTHEGKIVTLVCSVAGEKPVGMCLNIY